MESLIDTLLAVAGLLGLVSLLPPLAQRLRLPYTVVLAALGVGIGLLLHASGSLIDETGPVGAFIHAVGEVELTSSAFLYIFLPVLLFETALGVDVRRMMDDLGPILLLAIVAVLVCTLIAGLAMWWVWGFWHGMPTKKALIICLLLASIIATTDPAAVVSIFRDLGAPRRLTILVEGDKRLFNQYGVIVVNAVRHPHVKTDLAQAFADWIVSPAGQASIAGYKIGGEQHFFPNAKP